MATGSHIPSRVTLPVWKNIYLQLLFVLANIRESYVRKVRVILTHWFQQFVLYSRDFRDYKDFDVNCVSSPCCGQIHPITSLRFEPAARWPKVLTASHSFRRISKLKPLATRDVTKDVWLSVTKITLIRAFPFPAIWACAVCKTTLLPVSTCVLFPTDSPVLWLPKFSDFPPSLKESALQRHEWSFPLKK